jgi:hypothetical protein
VQSVPAHIDQETGRSDPPSQSSGGNRLINRPGARERDQNDKERHVLIVAPGEHRRNPKRIAAYASVGLTSR